MKTFFAKNWGFLASIAVIIFLLVIIFRGCGDGVDIKQERKEVDSVVQLMDQQRINHGSAIMHKNREIDSLKTAQQKTQLEANTARQAMKRLIAKGNGFVAAAPAEIKQEHNFDSLTNAFNDLSETAGSYAAIMDTLVEQMGSEMAIKDSIINLQVKFIQDMKKAADFNAAQYRQLAKDYVKSEKRRKSNAVLNKVLAGALIVAGSIAIAK